jgi:GDP-4-dehydro-6-deoxy-D-mannose reductase
MMEIIDITLNISTDELLVRPDDNKIIIGSNLKIYEDTGWRPSIPLETSLKDIIDYWMDNVPSS